MVANELGFPQRMPLPRKRDSVHDDEELLAPKPQTTGSHLDVPQIDLSRSASPILEAMSARIVDDSASMAKAAEAPEEPQIVRMSARVGA